MIHEAGRGAVVRPRADEVQLPAAALLRGRAQQPHPAGLTGRLERVDEADEGGQAGGRDQVVPAGVADAGQRIVLGVEDDEAPTGAEVGGEGGVDAVGLGGDDDAQVGKGRGGEERGEDGVGVVLVVGQLRVGVDLTEYYDEISVWSLRLLWT